MWDPEEQLLLWQCNAKNKNQNLFLRGGFLSAFICRPLSLLSAEWAILSVTQQILEEALFIGWATPGVSLITSFILLFCYIRRRLQEEEPCTCIYPGSEGCMYLVFMNIQTTAAIYCTAKQPPLYSDYICSSLSALNHKLRHSIVRDGSLICIQNKKPSFVQSQLSDGWEAAQPVRLHCIVRIVFVGV